MLLLILQHSEVVLPFRRINVSCSVNVCVLLWYFQSGLLWSDKVLGLEVFLFWGSGSESEFEEVVGPPGFHVLLVEEV